MERLEQRRGLDGRMKYDFNDYNDYDSVRDSITTFEEFFLR